MAPERKMNLKVFFNLMSEVCTAWGSSMRSLLCAPQNVQGGHANRAQEEQGAQSQQMQGLCFQQEKELHISCSCHKKRQSHKQSRLGLTGPKIKSKGSCWSNKSHCRAQWLVTAQLHGSQPLLIFSVQSTDENSAWKPNSSVFIFATCQHIFSS